MSLAELATVSNYECLKTLCVGVAVDLVIRLFLPFFSFPLARTYMPLIGTVPEQAPRALGGYIHN